jgi:putative Mg2+ transporter-C (MgtC) family protein
VPELGDGELALRLLIAAFLGGAIGFEREIREQAAGMRTHMLVCVGAALFTLVSAYGFSDWQFSTPEGIVFDPTRIAAQIVTGIGFLGAGAIIRHGLSVRGLTTAATLWLVAAIGMASGAGYYSAAVIATAGGLVTLWPLRLFEGWLLAHRYHRRLGVLLSPGTSASALLGELEKLGLRIESFEVEETVDGRHLSAEVVLPKGAKPSTVGRRVTELDHVRGVEWGE